MLPIVIVAALAFLGDRAMEYALIRQEATLMALIVCVLAALVLVLLVYLQLKHKTRKGGSETIDE